MVMIRFNIHDAKARLSEYLDAVAKGERVVISKRNRPVAELKSVGAMRETPRPVGGAKGRFEVPETFFEQLPDDVLEDFSGGSDLPASAPRVAEPPAPRSRAGRQRRTGRSS